MVSGPKQELSGEGSARIHFVTNVVYFPSCFLSTKVDFCFNFVVAICSCASGRIIPAPMLLSKSELVTAPGFFLNLSLPPLGLSLFCLGHVWLTPTPPPPNQLFTFFLLLHFLSIWVYPHFVLPRSWFVDPPTFLTFFYIFSKSELAPSLFWPGHKVRLAELHMAEPEANMERKQNSF